MRLFSLPDGTIDRKDRAQWLTVPFDLAFGNPAPAIQLTVVAQDVYCGGSSKSGYYRGGSQSADIYCAGSQKSSIYRAGGQTQDTYHGEGVN